MAGAEVRRLTERDVDAAIHLTDLEAWGYTRADFARLLALSPEGCLVAVRGREVVGVLTTTSYGDLAFLGAVIVAPTHRGEGVGRAMMTAALDRLSGTGVRTVRLNAYLDVIPFYEALGFRKEYEVIRWQGRPGRGEGGRARVATKADIRDLVDLDERHFGASRAALLERLLAEFSQTFWVAEEGGRPAGYIVGNPSPASCELGPWIVAPGHGDAARDLLRAVFHASGASTVAFAGPSENPDLLAFVQTEGLQEVFRTVRMTRGVNAHAGDPCGVWALAGLEKG